MCCTAMVRAVVTLTEPIISLAFQVVKFAPAAVRSMVSAIVPQTVKEIIHALVMPAMDRDAVVALPATCPIATTVIIGDLGNQMDVVTVIAGVASMIPGDPLTVQTHGAISEAAATPDGFLGHLITMTVLQIPLA